jgi:protocadherin Fat 4
LNADNIPQFSKRVYEAYISEDATPGLTVAKVEATDLDTGDFGKVRFTSINGPISNKY